MAFFVYEIGQHPKVEARLVDEIRRIMGDRKVPNLEDIEKMVYLNACWKVRDVLVVYQPSVSFCT